MSAITIEPPFPVFTDTDGNPLEDGYIYIGIENLNPETNPLQVYWDAALSIPAAQPLRTIGGYVSRNGSPGQLYADAVNYSILVKAKNGVLVWSSLSGTGISPNSNGITFIQAGTGAVATTVQAKLRESVSVKDFGAVGDGVTDDTAGLQAAINYAIGQDKTLRIPAGEYLYSTLTGLGHSELKILGDGSGVVKIVHTGTGEAIKIDGNGSFIQGIDVQGISIQGNTNTTSILYLRDVARSRFVDINVYDAENTAGIGFNFLGIQLNYFESLMCSQDRQAMTYPPYIGMQMVVSSMLLNCTNNTFVRCYAEGGVAAGDMKIGFRLYEATQNVFIGGASESLQTYGMTIGPVCSMNTFIGTGFESTSSTADILDGGLGTEFINCYASKSVVLQGSRAKIQNGYYERIEIQSGSIRNTIDSAAINHWATGAGGLFDSGTGTITRNIYDSDLAAYITDIKPRFSAWAPADVLNQTGAGAQVTVGFSEIFDDNNNFSSDTFTAPITGRYQLNAVVSLSALSTAATLTSLRIITSNRTYLTTKGLNPKAGGLQDSISMSVVADMDAGDTATVTIQVDGMAGDTASIIGNASTMWTTFSGMQV